MINSFFRSSFMISNSQFQFVHFPFWSSKLFQLYHFKASFNHCKVSPGVLFNFTLPFHHSISLDHSFVTGVLHEGSTWWFIKDLIPSQSFHRDSFKELKHSSFCNLECNSFLPYHWRWYYVILDNLSSCFLFHMLLRMRYFKSINLFIGDILGYISPKAFSKDCCFYGAYYWPKFFYPPGDISFSSPRSYQSNSFPVSGRLSPHNLRCIP